MTIKLLPLKGIDSYWAMHAYYKLLIGLKYLPAYLSMSIEEMLETIEQMPAEDRKKVVRQAVFIVTLDRDEVMAMIKFATDKNGVPFSRENTKDLAPNELMDILDEVAQAFAELEINFLSSSEKKNLKTSQSISGEFSHVTPSSH